MAQTQPYGMVMNCRNQNGIYASTVRAQYIGINLVPHQGALGGRNPILPQALANPFWKGLRAWEMQARPYRLQNVFTRSFLLLDTTQI